MFALIRGLLSLVIFAIVVWFAATVPIGKRTLWGHLKAISATPEARELAEGTREEALRVAERLRGRPQADAGAPEPTRAGGAGGAPPSAARPLDDVDDVDRRGLDELVRRAPAGAPAPKVTAQPAVRHPASK